MMLAMAGTVSHKIAAGLVSLAVPIGSVSLDPGNARVRSERSIEAIRKSLARFGQRRPLVANRVGDSLVLEAGEGVLLAAQAEGWSHVAVLQVEDSATQAIGYAITDNRTAELSYFEPVLLQALIQDLQAMDDMAVIGWSEADLEMMLSAGGDELPPQPDPASDAAFTENPYETRRDQAEQGGAVDGESKFRAYQMFVPVDVVPVFDDQCKRLAAALGTKTLVDTIMTGLARLAA